MSDEKNTVTTDPQKMEITPVTTNFARSKNNTWTKLFLGTLMLFGGAAGRSIQKDTKEDLAKNLYEVTEQDRIEFEQALNKMVLDEMKRTNSNFQSDYQKSANLLTLESVENQNFLLWNSLRSYETREIQSFIDHTKTNTFTFAQIEQAGFSILYPENPTSKKPDIFYIPKLHKDSLLSIYLGSDKGKMITEQSRIQFALNMIKEMVIHKMPNKTGPDLPLRSSQTQNILKKLSTDQQQYFLKQIKSNQLEFTIYNNLELFTTELMKQTAELSSLSCLTLVYRGIKDNRFDLVKFIANYQTTLSDDKTELEKKALSANYYVYQQTFELMEKTVNKLKIELSGLDESTSRAKELKDNIKNLKILIKKYDSKTIFARFMWEYQFTQTNTNYESDYLGKFAPLNFACTLFFSLIEKELDYALKNNGLLIHDTADYKKIYEILKTAGISSNQFKQLYTTYLLEIIKDSGLVGNNEVFVKIANNRLAFLESHEKTLNPSIKDFADTEKEEQKSGSWFEINEENNFSYNSKMLITATAVFIGISISLSKTFGLGKKQNMPPEFAALKDIAPSELTDIEKHIDNIYKTFNQDHSSIESLKASFVQFKGSTKSCSDMILEYKTFLEDKASPEYKKYIPIYIENVENNKLKAQAQITAAMVYNLMTLNEDNKNKAKVFEISKNIKEVVTLKTSEEKKKLYTQYIKELNDIYERKIASLERTTEKKETITFTIENNKAEISNEIKYLAAEFDLILQTGISSFRPLLNNATGSFLEPIRNSQGKARSDQISKANTAATKTCQEESQKYLTFLEAKYKEYKQTIQSKSFKNDLLQETDKLFRKYHDEAQCFTQITSETKKGFEYLKPNSKTKNEKATETVNKTLEKAKELRDKLLKEREENRKNASRIGKEEKEEKQPVQVNASISSSSAAITSKPKVRKPVKVLNNLEFSALITSLNVQNQQFKNLQPVNLPETAYFAGEGAVMINTTDIFAVAQAASIMMNFCIASEEAHRCEMHGNIEPGKHYQVRSALLKYSSKDINLEDHDFQKEAVRCFSELNLDLDSHNLMGEILSKIPTTKTAREEKNKSLERTAFKELVQNLEFAYQMILLRNNMNNNNLDTMLEQAIKFMFVKAADNLRHIQTGEGFEKHHHSKILTTLFEVNFDTNYNFKNTPLIDIRNSTAHNSKNDFAAICKLIQDLHPEIMKELSNSITDRVLLPKNRKIINESELDKS